MYFSEDELRFIKFLMLLLYGEGSIDKKIERLEWYEWDEILDRIKNILEKLEEIELLDKTKDLLNILEQ